jgi:hypothetical protein
LFSSNSKEEQEVEQKTAGQQELVQRAAPWNKDVTVEELLEGGCDKKHGMLEDNKEWYEKTDWWEKAVSDFEQKAAEKRARAEGENAAAKVLQAVHRTMRKPDPVIEKLKVIMELLETQAQEL